jgi:hypothetical protein
LGGLVLHQYLLVTLWLLAGVVEVHLLVVAVVLVAIELVQQL